MKLITAARFIELAAEQVGPLNRLDHLDSARIWLQGRSNNAWAEYAAGNSSLEQAKEADSALEEIKKQYATATLPKTYKITGIEQDGDDDYPVKVTFNVVARSENEARTMALQKVAGVRKIELVTEEAVK